MSENPEVPETEESETAPTVTPPDAESKAPDESSASEAPTSSEELADEHATAYAGFDPEIHRSGPDGKPIYTAKGEYAKKRGRKAGNAASALPSKNAANQANANGPASLSSEAAARQIVNLSLNLAVMTLGPEWAPNDKAEAEGLKNAFRDYFDARGVPAIPPEFGLVLAVGAYSLPRFNRPNTRDKLENLGLRLRHWIARIRGKQ